jgi:hypothetical protein
MRSPEKQKAAYLNHLAAKKKNKNIKEQGVAEGSDHSLKKVWDRYSKHLMAAHGHHPDVKQINKSGEILRNIRKYVKDHHGQKAVDDMERYAEKHQWNEDMAEGSQRVDSLVTDALKIMRGSDVNDAVQALKTVLGNREYNGRRGHYNFYVRQLMDMHGQQGIAEAKADYNFSIEDLKRLERIRDLPTLKAQAFELISKPSAKPMKPEKVEWFKGALERMNSPMKVIKLMYDLMLSGEGQSVIGTRSSMNPNSYRQRFGEGENIKEADEISPEYEQLLIAALTKFMGEDEINDSEGWAIAQGFARELIALKATPKELQAIAAGKIPNRLVRAFNIYESNKVGVQAEQQVNELGATPVAPPQGTATAQPTAQPGAANTTKGSISPDEQTALNKINQNPAMKQQLDKLMTQATPGGASAPAKLDQDEQDALNKIKANAGLGTQYAKLIKQANPASNMPTTVKP